MINKIEGIASISFECGCRAYVRVTFSPVLNECSFEWIDRCGKCDVPESRWFSIEVFEKALKEVKRRYPNESELVNAARLVEEGWMIEGCKTLQEVYDLTR